MEGVLIPLLMRTDDFINAWIEWIEYRTEVGKQMRWPTNPRCFTKAMRKCEQWGPERAAAAIDHSIEMGYRGIFEHLKFEARAVEKSPVEKKFDKWGGL